MVTYKKIFYNEMTDLQKLLEAADQKKDHLVANIVGPHKLAKLPSRYLVIVRLVIAAVLLFALANFRQDSGLLVAPLFLIAGLLHFTQQAFATKSEHKKIHILAALAERAVTLPVLFFSLITYNKTLLFLLLFMELANAFISLFALDNHINLKENVFGESKVSLHYLVLGVAALFWPASPNVFFVALMWISLIFMVISITIKTIEIKSYYEARKSQNLQHALGQKRGVKTA